MSAVRSLFAASLVAALGTSAFGAPIFVNFSNSPDASASTANSFNRLQFSSTATLDLNDETGAATTVTITRSGSTVTGETGAGPVTGAAAAAGITDTAAGDLFSTNGAGVLTFEGLDEEMNYTFTVFGGVSRGSTRLTRYTLSEGLVVSAFDDLQVSNPTNQSEVAVLSDTGGNAGTLTLSFTNAPGSASSFGYINALRIDATPVPEPGSMMLLGAGGACLFARRRNRG